MERFRQRENVLLGYNPQRSSETPISSPNASCRGSDIDFKDVFGGPPRRSSVQEMQTRYSFREKADSTILVGKEDTVSYPGRWSGLAEKPVFGGESVNRRRYPSDDFFDDIFSGDESYSSPRRTYRDPFNSTPGSRVLSLAHPLPPKAESFGSSLPIPFSLPARLTKVMDFPGFVSGNRSLYKYREGISNEGNLLHTHNASFSRFSSQAIWGQNELKHDAQPSYRQSPLSQQFSESSAKSSYLTKSNGRDMGDNPKKESKSAETPSKSNGQFHFSIYKWAGRGVPLLMSLRGGSSSKSKERGKTERCSSSNERIESGRIVAELQTLNLPDIESLFLGDSISANTQASKFESDGKENIDSKSTVEPHRVVDEAVLDLPESKSLNGIQCAAVNKSATVFSNKKEETMYHPMVDKDLSGNKEQKISKTTQEARKLGLKSPSSLFNDDLEGEGNVCYKPDTFGTESDTEPIFLSAGNDETAKKAEKKEILMEAPNLAHANDVDFSQNMRKHEGKRIKSVSTEVKEAGLQGSTINSGDNFERTRIKGKVKEFVKIFNCESGSKPQINVVSQSQSSRWRGTSTCGANNDARMSTRGTDKIMPNVNKSSDVCFEVEENPEQSGKQHCHIKMRPPKASDNSFCQKDSPSFSESVHGASKDTFGDIDDIFQGSFSIKELSHDHGKFLDSEEDHNYIQVSDAKIQKWSNGKKGNIRSLLSTLQYVLWLDSGWKPMPLVDIIEASAVKKAYQKALLCLHPDKLQQKGAASYQKYIAEKVFDILQEAWDHFNSLGSL